MNDVAKARMPWVIAQLGDSLFGVNCAAVREMVILQEVCEVPGVPDYMRGVINLRGQVTPLLDLRRRLGMRSASEETEALCQLMEQRAQDHKQWLDELDASVKEKRAFKLARDPHQCAFGKWYDTFKSDNIMVSSFLKKFDAPHKRIHALAAEAEELVNSQSAGQALEMLERARTGVLSVMLQLFVDFERLIRENSREIAVVLNGSVGSYAVAVDSVESVERLSEADTEALGGRGLELRQGFVTSVAKRNKGQDMVLILAVDSLLNATTHSGILRASGGNPRQAAA